MELQDINKFQLYRQLYSLSKPDICRRLLFMGLNDASEYVQILEFHKISGV